MVPIAAGNLLVPFFSKKYKYLEFLRTSCHSLLERTPPTYPGGMSLNVSWMMLHALPCFCETKLMGKAYDALDTRIRTSIKSPISVPATAEKWVTKNLDHRSE